MVTIAILLIKTFPVQSIVSTLTDAWLHNSGSLNLEQKP